MSKRRFIQQPDGSLMEVGNDYVREPRADHHVIGDIAPYRSMVDGSVINSRSHHREHLRQHGCVEVGNDSSLQKTQRPALQPSADLKERIAANVYDKLRY